MNEIGLVLLYSFDCSPLFPLQLSTSLTPGEQARQQHLRNIRWRGGHEGTRSVGYGEGRGAGRGSVSRGRAGERGIQLYDLLIAVFKNIIVGDRARVPSENQSIQASTTLPRAEDMEEAEDCIELR